MNDALSRINTARTIMYLQRQLTKMVATTSMLDSRTSKEACSGHLQALKDAKAILDFEVAEPVYRLVGWRQLYPNLGKRLLAMTAKLFRLPELDSEPRWYHHLFPYVHDMDHFVDEEFFEEGVEKQEIDKYVRTYFWARITYPHHVIDQDVYIQPVQPIERITLNFTIDRNGAKCVP